MVDSSYSVTSDGLKLPSTPEVRVRLQALAFLTACFVIFLRRPDALLNPQFFEESGSIWFAEAYNWGWWKALLFTCNGYIQVFPRLAAALALAVPLRTAPLVENGIAIALQAIPVNILLSNRSETWGPLGFRVALCVLYLALPNAAEMIGNLAVSQFVLGLIALLLLVARPPASRRQKIGDSLTFALCSLTGPFCIFLLPLSLADKRCDKRGRLLRTGIFAAGSVLQIGMILLHYSSRVNSEMGASVPLFLRILSGQVYLTTIIGANRLSSVLSWKASLAIAVTGTLVIFAASRISAPMLRLVLFSVLLFAATLASPSIPALEGATAWGILSQSPGSHYWFIPSLAFVWSIAFCFRSASPKIQICAGVLFVGLLFGIARDYRCKPLPDMRFASYAEQFSRVPKNTAFTIPQTPEGWQLTLVKH